MVAGSVQLLAAQPTEGRGMIGRGMGCRHQGSRFGRGIAKWSGNKVMQESRAVPRSQCGKRNQRFELHGAVGRGVALRTRDRSRSGESCADRRGGCWGLKLTALTIIPRTDSLFRLCSRSASLPRRLRFQAKLGTPMSVIKSRPGGAFRMRGAALTREATVAPSPATPPLMIMFIEGSPSI